MGAGTGSADVRRGGVVGRSPVLAVLLAWLLPGMGHVYLGRWKRGLLYAVILLFMLGFGLALEGTLSRPRSGELLALLATLADMGLGPVYFLLRAAGDDAIRAALVDPAVLSVAGHSAASSATHEFGNTFHWSAGLMNMLLVLDAHDVASGRK